MPLAIVAGMPIGKARQLKSQIDYISHREDWNVVWVPARKNQPELKHCWHEVESIADGADEHGVHILAYNGVGRERKRYEREVRFRHRLVWLTHSHLYGEPNDAWWLEIEDHLRLEVAWRSAVRPPNQHHPLILPARTFASREDPWTMAQDARTDRGFARVRAAIRRFSEDHRHQGEWRDDNSLLFDSRGPEHGRAPDGRRWKFTYRLPAGFHFDVRHENQRQFSIVDADRVRQTFRDYTNVDAHGHVRGGE